MQLIIDTSNTYLTVKNKSFFIQNETVEKIISTARVSSIAITTNCTLNAAVIKLAAQNQIPIYFFDTLGNIEARVCSPYFFNLATLRKKQWLFYDTFHATTWVIQNLKNRITLEIQTLQQTAQHFTSTQKSFQPYIEKLSQGIKQLELLKENNMDQCRNILLGNEGNLSRIYFESIQLLLPENFQFAKRSRQPALDYFNAALNYLYGMTYSVVESAVFAKGLDPFIGFLHTENYQKTALVFDLIEPFRPIVDRMLIQLCSENQLNENHFVPKGEGFWLSKEGKKVLIPAFNDLLYHRIKINNQVRMFKDHIYHVANDLGNLIDSSID